VSHNPRFHGENILQKPILIDKAVQQAEWIEESSVKSYDPYILGPLCCVAGMEAMMGEWAASLDYEDRD